MKKITFILSAALLLTLGVSSCMDDFDTPVTGNAYGNNTINCLLYTSDAADE